MKHALIIDRDGEVSRTIEERLLALGFRSFEHAWSEDAAVAAAARKRPDLVVIGEQLEAGSPFSAARRICADEDIPAIFAARQNACPAPPPDASLSGPFPLREIGRAVREAEEVPLAREAAA